MVVFQLFQAVLATAIINEGAVAQLGARVTGSHEVVGSIPTGSINDFTHIQLTHLLRTSARLVPLRRLMSAAKPHVKAEAIRLRIEERRSLREIEVLTNAARSSLSLWLRPYPLTEDEKRARNKSTKRYVTPKKRVV